MAARVELYRDDAGEWRWRRVAVNEEVIATSGEGYKNQLDAATMAKQLFPGIPVYLLDEPPPE